MAKRLFFYQKQFVMAKEKYEDNEQSGNSDASIKPDPGTTDTTDPQEHMDGPISSLVKGAADAVDGKDKNGAEDKEE